MRDLVALALPLTLTGLVLPLLAGEGENSGSRICPTPVNYCYTSPNSVGAGAVISWTGTPSLATDDFHLVVTGGPPDQFLMYYYGGGQLNMPFGNGRRCVEAGGVGLYRFQPLLTDAGGSAIMKVDWTQPPAGDGPGQWMPGDLWYCQGWYRDPADGGWQFNLTGGLEVPVCASGGAYHDMVLVPAGTFEMGRHVGNGGSEELPVHTVHLDAFYMDKYEVTNQEYANYLNSALAEGRVTVSWAGSSVSLAGGAGERLCMTAGGSDFSHITWDGSVFDVTTGWEEHPVVKVSWYGACTYANQLSRYHGLTPSVDEITWTCDFAADGHRLPTEAEWEYAARGGQHSPYYKYPWFGYLNGSRANYNGSGDPYEGFSPETTPVGYYDGNQIPPGAGDRANGYGLYDVAGNVREWCWDAHDYGYYTYSPPNNPTGPPPNGWRVIRGGGWWDGPANLRCASRDQSFAAGVQHDVGFRVVARP